jgi:hypothetical protein
LPEYARIPRVLRPVTKAATLDQVEALAASYEPGIAAAVLKALEQSSESVDLDALAEALAAGQPAEGDRRS